MATTAIHSSVAPHPVNVHVEPQLDHRDRLSVGIRIVLALPHLILVGGPLFLGWSWSSREAAGGYEWSTGGGALGAVAVVIAIIAWFAILFTGTYPEGLRQLAEYYLRWRVRAVAYLLLLRDEYPPFGEGRYPVTCEIAHVDGPRDRLAVGFRVILAIPHLVALWVLGIAVGVTTVVAWFAILLTGRFPAQLYTFAVGVLQWTTRVEAWLLLLHDGSPPFALH
ncbi:MAG: DUF4389 domain-containing protein [Gemmatimonadaceae bacterium]|nr:DUF4389 domain-containing protein [Gemmatimonadaceae bacterium]